MITETLRETAKANIIKAFDAFDDGEITRDQLIERVHHEIANGINTAWDKAYTCGVYDGIDDDDGYDYEIHLEGK